jgi:WD40 repeat protein
MRAAFILVLLGVSTWASAAPLPPVTALAVSSRGDVIAAGTRGVVHLLDAKSGKELGTLSGQITRVTGLAFSNRGWLAVASGEAGKSGIVRLYEFKEGSPLPTKPTLEIPAHKDIIYALDFSPDGKTLATAGYDRLIKLWDIPLAKSEPRLTFTDHSDTVTCLAFHPKGELLASAGADRAIKVWDVATGKRLYTLSDSTDWVNTLAWHPNGKHLAAAGADKTVRVWSAEREPGPLVHATFAHESPIFRLFYTPNGTALITVGEDKVIKLWSSDKMTETATWAPQPDSILAAILARDGSVLLGRFDGFLQQVDSQTGKLIRQLLPIQSPTPELKKLSIPSVHRGGTVTLALEGLHLDRLTGLKTVPPGNELTFEIVKAGRTSERIEVVCRVSPTATIGDHSLVGTSPAGNTAPAIVKVERFAITREDVNLAQNDVHSPTTILGSLERAGNTDLYRFSAKAGEEIGVQITPQDPKSLDPHLTLRDEKGQLLAESNQGLLGYKCQTAGTFILGVSDKELRGGPTSTYRLHLGPIPIITQVFPIAATRGMKNRIHLRGVNLGNPDGLWTEVAPEKSAPRGQRVPLVIPAVGGEVPLGAASIPVTDYPSLTLNPTSNTLAVPGSADGILAKPGATQLLRFPATRGQRLIVEVLASRIGSPLDSLIEILTEQGEPLQRATLRAVAQTAIVLRDHDSDKPGIRIETWNDLKTNDYLYAGSELMRIKALPKNPDDDCQFYQVDGKRVGFLDTTPTHHAMNETLYKVEIHPPGSTFPPNGLPVFPLPYFNDDGGPGFQRDSRIAFDPPATGTYQIRLRDTRGRGGDHYAYRVTVRPPQPDFAINVNPMSPTVPQGSGLPLAITATRSDEFDGPIAIRFPQIQPPFSAPDTLIEAGQLTATVPLMAESGSSAKAPSEILVRAEARIDGQLVIREARLTAPKLGPAGDLRTTTSVSEVSVKPGGEVRMLVRIERRSGFNARVPIEVRGLPHGVRVENIGLNGILMPPGIAEREIVIRAEPWVQAISLPFVVVARNEGKKTEHAAPAVVLNIKP